MRWWFSLLLIAVPVVEARTRSGGNSGIVPPIWLFYLGIVAIVLAVVVMFWKNNK